jgi:hypothetical protein
VGAIVNRSEGDWELDPFRDEHGSGVILLTPEFREENVSGME